MTSNRPYVIRALHAWIDDNGCTPYLLVNADFEGVDVPRGNVEEGRIVLNISGGAVQQLELGNDFIAFQARFAGRPTQVFVPIDAVLAIYARENGQGMVFPLVEPAHGEGADLDATGSSPEPTQPTQPTVPGGGRPRLKVVK